jgi:hypothetical protein
VNGCMEDYRRYMDRVSVDEDLHRGIMSRMVHKPMKKFCGVRRCVAVLASVVVIAVGIWVVPRLPCFSHATNSYIALVFNRTEEGALLDLAKRYIPGYFKQELSQEDTASLFGDAWRLLNKDYEVIADAGFSGQGVLEEVFVTFKKRRAGKVIKIHMIADEPVLLDYLYPDHAELSDVNGTVVMAGFWKSSSTIESTHYYAAFVLDGTGYYVESVGDETAKEDLTAIVGMIIESGGQNLSRIKPDSIPNWREDVLTLTEAKDDPDFGMYAPNGSPDDLTLESARRVLNQRQNQLCITWSSGMRYLRWTIRPLEEQDIARVVDVDVPETYDLGLYPIPRAESVPTELRAIVDNPIVKAEELTMEFVRARSYTVNDAGDDNTGYRMNFGVLYGDILVELRGKGVNPETIYDMLEEIVL